MRGRWRASGTLVVALAVATCACTRGEPTEVDLLREVNVGIVEPVTTTIAVGEPDGERFLGDGWDAPTRLADGTAGRAVAGRTATITLFAGQTPVDGELRLEERLLETAAPPRRPRRGPTVALVDLNGVRLRPIRDRTEGLSRFRLPAGLQRPGRNVLTLRRFSPGVQRRLGAQSIVTRVELRHVAPPHPTARLEGDRLLVPGGDGTTIYFRALHGSRLSLAVEPPDPSARVTLLRDFTPPQDVPLAGGVGTADVDAPAGTILGLRIAADRDVALVRPRLAGRVPTSGALAVVDRRPNVIVYVADTLRADGLGCYGHRGGTSPNLDRLAAEGIVFERALSSSSWTRPAVATVMTGLDPFEHGALTIRDGLRDDARTLAERLRAQGWETAAFVTNANVAPTFGFGRGFDVYRYLPEDPDRHGVHVPAADAHDAALAWLDGRASARPFLLYLHATDVHMPYTPPDDLGRRFVGATRWATLDRDRLLRLLDQRPDFLDAGDAADARGLYDAEIAQLDAAIGALWARLAARGLDRSTLLVFAGDHGEEFAEHGGFEHGTTLFDEQVRVPLVLRLPGGRGGGGRAPDLARLLDVTPTVLALAGLPADPALPGMALVDASGVPSPPAHEARAWTGVSRPAVSGLDAPPWKVVLAGAGRVEAYDLATDPAERRNRSAEVPVLVGYARRRLADVAPRRRPPAAPIDPDVAERLRRLGYAD